MSHIGHGDTAMAGYLTPEERERSVVITDPFRPDNPIIFVSDEFERQTGFPPEEALGRNCRFLQGPGTDSAAKKAIRDALEARTEITIDILNYRRDRSEFWNRLRIRPLFDDGGRLLYFAGVQNPIAASEVRLLPIDVVFD